MPGTTDTGNHCAWCDTLITLPFPFVLYDQTFNAVNVNSSGRLDFVCTNEPSNYTETCLPAPPNNCPYDYTIFALWDEWYTGTATGCSTWANGCGIFTSISGTAPNRIFNIEWHVVNRENDVQTGDFEVRLYENDPNKRFEVIYGSITRIEYRFRRSGRAGADRLFHPKLLQDLPAAERFPHLCDHDTLPNTNGNAYTDSNANGAITVTNTNDSGPGSLRQALADATNGDTINFDPSLNGQTITLTTAELAIDNDVTILGPGPNLLTVARSSQTQFRIFHVMPGHDVTVEGIHITGGGGDFGSYGGGVLNDHANLIITNCSLTTNGSYLWRRDL